jgi:hypothetical protein
VAPTRMNEAQNYRNDFLNGMEESLKLNKRPLNSERMENKLKAIETLEELRFLRA